MGSKELEAVLRGALSLVTAGEQPTIVTSQHDRVLVCAVRCATAEEAETLRMRLLALHLKER